MKISLKFLAKDPIDKPSFVQVKVLAIYINTSIGNPV